ncbi:MAG: hypothetical protein K2J48_00195, partial [Muribaculaceae bacterium]|nr:hypothetical protein [Muribaculaceae bacterium]
SKFNMRHPKYEWDGMVNHLSMKQTKVSAIGKPSGQPWLYSGNERLRMDGINEYDFNARRYNSALGWLTIL